VAALTDSIEKKAVEKCRTGKMPFDARRWNKVGDMLDLPTDPGRTSSNHFQWDV
jgi:hypothetical protein